MIPGLLRVRREFGELRRFGRLQDDRPGIVFYAEFAGQRIYFEPMIEQLTMRFGRTVYYVTSSADDAYLDAGIDNVEAFYIGSGSARTAFFAGLRANLVVMTLVDFGNQYIKRSKYPVQYVFVPHNLTSTHMVFPAGAHNHYDTVFCAGPHQVAELREAEGIYGLAPRELAEIGYCRLDALHEEYLRHPSIDDASRLRVTIAPSWGPAALIESGCAALVESLVTAGHQVIIRPHRETRRRAAAQLEALRSRYADDPAVSWAEGPPSNAVVLDSHLLITDWSGSGLSFAFATERPVLFIDLPPKINNPDFHRFTSPPFEMTAREIIGQVLSPEDYAMAGAAVSELWAKRDSYRDRIRTLRGSQVFNFRESAVKAAARLDELAGERQ